MRLYSATVSLSQSERHMNHFLNTSSVQSGGTRNTKGIVEECERVVEQIEVWQASIMETKFSSL